MTSLKVLYLLKSAAIDGLIMALYMNVPPRVDQDRKEAIKSILNLTLEIIYQITGEGYTVVKKIFDESLTLRNCPYGSGGWCSTQNPNMEAPYHSLIYDKKQKILDLTNKIIELLTGEVPLRCHDVTVHFSMEEWEYLEGHKDLYKDVMMENEQPFASSDGCSKINPPERSPSPLDSQHRPEEDHNVSQDHQGEELLDINVEVMEEERLYERGPNQYKEDTIPANISPDGYSKDLRGSLYSLPYCEAEVENITHDSAAGNLFTQMIDSRHNSRDHSSSPSKQEQPFLHRSDTIRGHCGHELFLRSELENKFRKEASRLIQRALTDTALLPSSDYVKCLTQKDSCCNHPKSPKTVTEFSCSKQFNQKSYLTHQQRIHRGVMAFSKYFSSKSNLAKHKIHTGKKRFPCSKCGQCFVHKSVLIKHKKFCKGNKLFLSRKCGKESTDKSRLIHQQRNHTEEMPYSCSECGRRFIKKCNLARHHTVHKRKEFSCSESDNSITKNTKVIQHQKTQLGDKPFACQDCEECYTKKLDLIKHRRIHTVGKPFSCSECAESFTRKSGLVLHQKIHNVGKRFSCSECEKSFIEKSDLVEHQRSYLEEAPFSCMECGRLFAQKAGLLAHIRIHTGEKLYKCLECEKCFSQKSGLTAHERIHTGEKPFSCSECDKSFAQKTGLIAHLRTHTGEKPFLCLECGKVFAQQASLTAHLRTHTGEKPFACSECGKCFSQKAGLIAHLKIHPGD
ncbi:zinc finger protein ZFP2-like [Eleutherodactylus coqui]|uniref:zinc finger protein ZFP2-like n=1 Tax=Eleutherodactylus coqui TaxID=57060 RepID=UPI003462BAC9